MILIRILFATLFGFFLAGCGTMSGGLQGCYYKDGVRICGGGQGTTAVRPPAHGGYVQQVHGQRIAHCDGNKTVAWHPKENREVCALRGDQNVIFPGQPGYGVARSPQGGGPVCDNNKSVAWHPGLNRQVCAYRGDTNVIFPGQPGYRTSYNDNSQPLGASSPIYGPQGARCQRGEIWAVSRVSGAEGCMEQGDPNIILAHSQGGKDPYSSDCKSGGRMFGGRYICMD